MANDKPKTTTTKGRIMAQQPTNKPTTAEQIAAFKAKQGAVTQQVKGGTITAGSAAEAQAAAQKVEDKDKAPEPEPVRHVDPKVFPFIKSSMGGLDSYMVVLNMQEIVDYVTYATDLYDVVEDGSELPANQTWQRAVNPKRVGNDIKPYLQQKLHFFPPIITVVGSDDIAIDEVKKTITLTADNEEGHGNLGALDGQHRFSGIVANIAELGIDGDFARETMPILIIGSNISLDDRQQIFSDVNRTPKTVSKALSTLYDHRDLYAGIAKGIAEDLKHIDGSCMVDMIKTTPSPTSSHIASLSNLYNLAVNFGSSEPKKHSKPLRNGVDARDVKDVCLATVESMPWYHELQKKVVSYKVARGEDGYICYSSTIFQAIGTALVDILTIKNIPKGQWVETVKTLVGSTNWENKNKDLWSRPGQEVRVGNKTGTQQDHVSRAVAILKETWGQVELPEHIEGAAQQGNSETASMGATA